MTQWIQTVEHRYLRLDKIVQLEVCTYYAELPQKDTMVMLEVHTEDGKRHIMHSVSVPKNEDHRPAAEKMDGLVKVLLKATAEPDPFVACFYADGTTLEIG